MSAWVVIADVQQLVGESPDSSLRRDDPDLPAQTAVPAKRGSDEPVSFIFAELIPGNAYEHGSEELYKQDTEETLGKKNKSKQNKKSAGEFLVRVCAGL